MKRALVIPEVTAANVSTMAEIEHRASVDLALADMLPTRVAMTNAMVPGRIIGVRLRWYYAGANNPDPAMRRWAFDRYNSRLIVQRRTASAVETEASYGAVLTRTLTQVEDALGTIQPLIDALAPTQVPEITWQPLQPEAR